ncbi:extensin [Burkholderia cepacia]|uniref:Extensin n=2 Tax=Burkholderia cepacia TaxID=292 RepID=A0AAX2RDT7_BURCE|nr:extensin [Burkholderia cepacia]TES71048.1 extensin [Burkholderia cepacia]TES99048.1 extensin [Burkholderia cepacia]TEU35871.1 extensin [Burkholderia cepacia]TEU36144.1 extensin [Burkholderia cepacia]TEU41351.1 extensin [Burkholderia cepacia]
MTSTRKTLMIAGGLLVAAAGTAYVMLLRADHRAIEDAGIGDSAAPAAVAPANNDHAVQGAIAPPAPAARADTASKQAAVSPQPPAPATPAPAPAPARVSAAPASVPAVPVVSEKAQPSAPPPKVNVVTVDAQDSTPPAAAPAAKPARAVAPAQVTQRAPRKRDGLERHAAAAPSATKSETPETAALVRESAKLDPSLPPPPMSSTSSTSSSAGSYRQGGSSSGANPVAAAMTEQLVRQSSSVKAPSPAPVNDAPTTTK